MDTFDRRRTLSLLMGLAALGLAFAVAHVNETRSLAQPTPAVAAAGRG
jgi:hypothetical protein